MSRRFEEITVDGDVVFSAGPPIVDNFESGNLNAYSNVSGAQISSSTVAEGAFSLQLDNPIQPVDAFSEPGDGLAAYPEKGQKFSWLVTEGTDDFPCVYFGLDASGPDGYYVCHQPTNNAGFLRRVDGGSTPPLTSVSASMNFNEFYEYEIQWHDGSGSFVDNTLELTIFDIDSNLNRLSQLGSTTVVDSTYPNNKGIGFTDETGFGDGTAFVDNYKIIGPVD